MQVLQGKIDILSSNGLDDSIVAPAMHDGSIKAFSPDRDPIVQYVNQQMEQYVRTMREMAEEMQHALQHISDELADEIVREQKHLVLMQDQVGTSPFRAWTDPHMHVSYEAHASISGIKCTCKGQSTLPGSHPGQHAYASMQCEEIASLLHAYSIKQPPECQGLGYAVLPHALI